MNFEIDRKGAYERGNPPIMRDTNSNLQISLVLNLLKRNGGTGFEPPVFFG